MTLVQSAPDNSCAGVEQDFAKVQIDPSPHQGEGAPEGSTRKEPSLRPV
jgi:hypothetical protein